MRKILLILLFFCLFTKPVQAITDPLATTNNRFGIHVLDLDDLKPAADLVNSQGGDWGYVTLVIRQNDQNQDKWQTILDKCRELKLIPIVRLATYPKDDYWVKPEASQIDSWVKFLNSLNWVIQNRYITLFNEPNHAKEWGNQINPQEYVKTVKEFSKKLKAASEDFFILPAGFDTAAPNSSTTMSAQNYWQQMYQTDPDIFQVFDGWNSHSYPNPGFSGPVTGQGFGSLTSFQSELHYLVALGLDPNLPVFITETGWIHKQGQVLGATTNPTTALSEFYTTAFKKAWQKPNLVAVTPFILNYPQPPFDQFAWQKPDSKEFYPHYYAVQDLPKSSGNPIQIHDSNLVDTQLPNQLIDSSTYQLPIIIKNTGQSIWEPEDYFLKITTDLDPASYSVSTLESTKPFQDSNLTFTLNTPPEPTNINLKLQLQHHLKPFGEILEQQIKIIPPPNLVIKAKRLFVKDRKPTDYQLIIYDQDNQVLKEQTISLKAKLSQPIKLYDLIPDTVYRFVLLKPFYLPRQVIASLNSTSTEISFKTLLPLDFNQDGQFNLKDLIPWQN